MSLKQQSINAAAAFRRSMSWVALISGLAALIGSWASLTYEPNLLLTVVIGFTSAWAVISQQVEGLILCKVLNIRTPGIVYFALAIVSPMRIALIVGALIGTSIYLLMLAMVVGKTQIKLVAGDRFYQFIYPFSSLIPLSILSDETLSPIFEPFIAFHWTIGPFNIKIWRLSIFDPPAIYTHICHYGTRLCKVGISWYDTLACFRRAAGLLYLLDTLSRTEEYDLDGVALAASARLALSEIPETSRLFLREVLRTMNGDRQNNIRQSFDLA